MPRLAANIGMLFPEVDLLDRLERAASGGFRGVEIPSPYRETTENLYLFDRIDRLGFDGWVGCEYHPRNGTVEGLVWARPYGIRGGG